MTRDDAGLGPRSDDPPIVLHGSMYVDQRPGTICNPGGGFEPMVTTNSAKVTCPACRQRIDGGPAPTTAAINALRKFTTTDPDGNVVVAVRLDDVRAALGGAA